MDGGTVPAPDPANASHGDADGRARSGPRVLFVDHSSRIAGAELVLLDVIEGGHDASAVFLFQDGPLVEAIQARGVSFLVSRGAGDLSAIRRDRSLVRALPQAMRLLATAREIARAARSRDIVYANSQKAFVLAALARAGTWPRARRPLVWHLHDILDRSHFGAAQIRVGVALANRLAALVIVPSAAARDAFVAAGGRPALVLVVANGIDMARPAETRSVLRARFDLPAGFLFGVFSRLAPWKGQHIAIEALSHVPGAHCVIVGDAQFGEHGYAQSLRDLALERGVVDRVRFLGHRDDIADLMSAVDAVVHPSVDPEPFGRTLVEAMALGIPVIATDCGAAAEILDHGRCGRLVPPAQAGEVAAALRCLRSDPDAAAASVRAAHARAHATYGAERMRTTIRAALADLPPARHGTPARDSRARNNGGFCNKLDRRPSC